MKKKKIHNLFVQEVKWKNEKVYNAIEIST